MDENQEPVRNQQGLDGITRRSFLRAAAVTGVTSILGSSSASPIPVAQGEGVFRARAGGGETLYSTLEISSLQVPLGNENPEIEGGQEVTLPVVEISLDELGITGVINPVVYGQITTNNGQDVIAESTFGTQAIFEGLQRTEGDGEYPGRLVIVLSGSEKISSTSPIGRHLRAMRGLNFLSLEEGVDLPDDAVVEIAVGSAGVSSIVSSELGILSMAYTEPPSIKKVFQCFGAGGDINRIESEAVGVG